MSKANVKIRRTLRRVVNKNVVEMLLETSRMRLATRIRVAWKVLRGLPR